MTSNLLLVIKRWQKLRDELWDKKTRAYNISKVTEIYDAVRYDLMHHRGLAAGFMPLYSIAQTINSVVVPNEYGYDEVSRMKIGTMVCGRLLRKLLIDLNNSVGAGASVDDLPEQDIVTAVQYLHRKRRILPGFDYSPDARSPSKQLLLPENPIIMTTTTTTTTAPRPSSRDSTQGMVHEGSKARTGACGRACTSRPRVTSRR